MNEYLENELNIDTEEIGPSVMVAFGYRKENPREKTRQALEDVTTWYN